MNLDFAKMLHTSYLCRSTPYMKLVNLCYFLMKAIRERKFHSFANPKFRNISTFAKISLALILRVVTQYSTSLEVAALSRPIDAYDIMIPD